MKIYSILCSIFIFSSMNAQEEKKDPPNYPPYLHYPRAHSCSACDKWPRDGSPPAFWVQMYAENPLTGSQSSRKASTGSGRLGGAKEKTASQDEEEEMSEEA